MNFSNLIQRGDYGPGLFGPATDGNLVIAANTTLTRSYFLSSLTVNATRILTAASVRIQCNGTVSISGTISANGAVGASGLGVTGGTGGSGVTAYDLGTPGAGGLS